MLGRLQPDARSQRRHTSPRSAEAIHTVRRICNEEFADRVELRIVDVGEQPALLTGAGGAPIVDAPAGDVSGHDIDPATPLPIDLMSPSSPRRRTGHHRRGGSEWPHPPPECWSVGSPCGFLSLCSSGFESRSATSSSVKRCRRTHAQFGGRATGGVASASRHCGPGGRATRRAGSSSLGRCRLRACDEG